MGFIILIIWLIILFWILLVVDVIIRRFTRKENITFEKLLPFSKAFEAKPVLAPLLSLALLAIFLYNSGAFGELVGIEKPLSKRSDGTYCYYVEAVEEKTDKEYTVPAKITVESWVDDDGDGRKIGGVDYFIEQLLFDDGSIVDFGDSAFDEKASFKYSTRYYDEDGNEWECMLTEEHAYSKAVQETSFVSARRVILMCIVVGIILFNTLGSLYLAGKEKKKENNQ